MNKSELIRVLEKLFGLKEDKDYLRKVMNSRKMLVTQKVGDDFGALYDETRYAATDPKGVTGYSFRMVPSKTLPFMAVSPVRSLPTRF